jgi:HEAT repeat protein
VNDALIDALDDPGPRVRIAVLNARAHRTDRRVTASQLRALSDEDAGVRWVVARQLGLNESPELLEELLQRVARGDELGRQGAAQALGFKEDARAIAALLRALGDGSAGVRQAASASLRRLATSNAVAALAPEDLVSAALSGIEPLQRSAVAALRYGSDGRPRLLLVAALDDQSEHVRHAAALSLGAAGRFARGPAAARQLAGSR